MALNYCRNKRKCPLRGVCSELLLSSLRIAPTKKIKDCVYNVRFSYTALLRKMEKNHEEKCDSILVSSVSKRLNPLCNIK